MAGRKKEFNFKLGEKVTAKWPGSNMYYSGVVTKLRRDHQYEIKFGDDSFHTVHPRNVHTPSPTPEREDPSKKSSSSTTITTTTTKIKKKTASKSPSRKTRTKSKSPSRKRQSSKSPSRIGLPRAAKSSPSRSSPQIRARKSRSRSKTPGDSVETVKTVKKVKTTPPSTRKSNSIPRKTSSRSSLRITSKSIQQPINPSYEKLQRMGFEMEWIRSEEDTEEDTEESPRDEEFSDGFQNFATSIFIAMIVILLPMLVFWINLSCDRLDCTLSVNKFPVNTNDYLDMQSMLVFMTWLLFQMILAIMPLGYCAEGQSLIDGARLRYRLNGLQSFVITMAVLCGLIYTKISFDVIFDKWLQLITASVVVSYFTCFYLMIRARKALLKDMTRGIPDTNTAAFFFGRELNPRIGDFDLKFFTLSRPSMMTWAVLNVLILYQEYQTCDAFYPSIWFVGISQLIYILDGFIFEEAFLSGWDITKEGCGFLAVFGSFCFAPFIFTIILRYLLLHRPTIDIFFLTAIIAVNIVAYCIYRVSNNQKDEFRRNPYHQKFITANTIETRTTRKIFVDGWWKHLRHPNYLGDIMIALTWSLPCGFDNVIPYTYLFYLFIFLTHRAYRDDKVCLKKYGNAWVSYCKLVPYRVIPYCY